MALRMKVAAAMAAICLITATHASADSSKADGFYATGTQLLSRADFEGALGKFKKATQEDPARIEYRNEHSLLRRVIKLRGEISQERDALRWQGKCESLRAYYYDRGLFGEALGIDRAGYKKFGSQQRASLLAETLLELNRNQESVEVLAGHGTLPIAGGLFRGIALARLDKLGDARRVLQDVALPDQPPAILLFHRARLQALLGDACGAVTQLTRMLEMVPPDRIVAARARILGSADFASLAAKPEFATVLRVQSKVKQSSCSSGPSCGQCPSKSKCSSAAAPACASGK